MSKQPSLKDDLNLALNIARGETQPSENVEKTSSQEETNGRQPGFSGWIKWVLSPGIGDGVINFTRGCIFILLLFLSIMSLIRYNIHFIILTIITIILYACFEFTIQELRKYPELMSGKIPDSPNEKEDSNNKTPMEGKPKEE